MDKVILIGYFNEIIELCEKCDCLIVGYVDSSEKGPYPYLGTDETFISNYSRYVDIPLVITPDNPDARSAIYERYNKLGFKFRTLIAPDASISKSAIISDGCMIQGLCNVSSNSFLGKCVRVNTGANIMHDVRIEDFSVVAPNAVILGYTTAEKKVYIGANSTVLSHLRIGNGSIVGAGSVVTKDVMTRTIVVGVPAYVLKKNMSDVSGRRINAIVQARMRSTRLPGKVLMNIEGIPILEHIVNRLKAVKGISAIIVATSIEYNDDSIESWCNMKEIACVRGSEENVLDRFKQVSTHYPADVYIRATGDNPMIDVQLIVDMLNYFDKNELTYTCYKNYPIGSGVEIFTSEALEETIKNANKPFEIEHVTPFMYQRMENKKVGYYVSRVDDSKIRMTIDTEADLQFAKEVFSRLYDKNPLFGIDDVKRLLSQEVYLADINNSIRQKKLGE